MKNGFLVLLSLFVPMLSAEEVDVEKQVELVHEVRKALMTAQIKPQNNLTIEEPARSFYHFGAVLDKSFTVIAVTPGSDAQVAGIKTGDSLISVNSQIFNNAEIAQVLAYMNDLQDGDVISVQVKRGADEMTFSSKVKRQTLPAWRLQLNPDSAQTAADVTTTDCGYVSVFLSPPLSLHRHALGINEIKAINFKGGLFFRSQEQVLKVPTGEIELTVQELISPDAIKRYRSDLQRRKSNATKTFTLKVEPNTVYHLAAEYFANKSERQDKDEYWQPIVWKTTARSCE
jgi:hypothetical protein